MSSATTVSETIAKLNPWVPDAQTWGMSVYCFFCGAEDEDYPNHRAECLWVAVGGRDDD